MPSYVSVHRCTPNPVARLEIERLKAENKRLTELSNDALTTAKYYRTDNEKQVLAMHDMSGEIENLKAENERLRADLLSGAPAYYERWKEANGKNERLATLCRSMLRYLEITGAHSVGDHKNCAPCQFEKEFEEIENGKV